MNFVIDVALRGARPEDPSCPRLSNPTAPDASSPARPSQRRHADRRRHHRDRRGRDRPGDAATQAQGPRASRRGSRSAWLALVVGLAILAPSCRSTTRRRSPPTSPAGSVRRRRHRAGPPPRRRLQRARHALAPDLGRSHDAGRRDRWRVHHRLRARRDARPLAGYFRGKVDTVVSLRVRRVPRHPRGDPRARAGHHPAHATGHEGQAVSIPRSR